MMFKGNAKAKQIKCKVKESVGNALGDSSVQRAGRREQLRGKPQKMTESATATLRQWTKP